jgi:hypothetical protein
MAGSSSKGVYPGSIALPKYRGLAYPGAMMKSVSCLLLALVLSALLAPAQAKPLAWTGIGVQSMRGMPSSHWRIHLAFDAVGNARIDYPSLHCGGVLKRVSRSGNVTEFRERLRYGRKTCVDNGTVKTWRRGNRLVWRWTGEHTHFPAMRARATLVLARHRGLYR